MIHVNQCIFLFTTWSTRPQQNTPYRQSHLNLPTLPQRPHDQRSRHLTMKFALVLLALISVVIAVPAPQDTIPDAGTAETTDGPDSLSFGFGGSQSECECRTTASSKGLGGR